MHDSDPDRLCMWFKLCYAGSFTTVHTSTETLFTMWHYTQTRHCPGLTTTMIIYHVWDNPLPPPPTNSHDPSISTVWLIRQRASGKGGSLPQVGNLHLMYIHVHDFPECVLGRALPNDGSIILWCTQSDELCSFSSRDYSFIHEKIQILALAILITSLSNNAALSRFTIKFQ